VPSKEVASNFSGFGPDALSIFERLSQSNTRDTFLALKPDYERALREPALDLVADLNEAFDVAGVPLHGDPKRALFRPNRDVRFAKDKSPYKTNISFVMTRSGEKHDNGLFYFQLGLDGVFAAAGFYVLEPSELEIFRQRMIDRAETWREVRASLEATKLVLSTENTAKRVPRGLPEDIPADLRADILLKSFTVDLPLSVQAVSSADLVEVLARFARDALPLLQFGWEAF
jgi:uncharacterized protein (TIGR02453 family)